MGPPSGGPYAGAGLQTCPRPCSFTCAGYFVSRVAVTPLGVLVCADPIAELGQRGAALRALPDLWLLRDAVVASSLQFSIIRMRNAQPRSTT